jgi:hypothetical protein
MYEMNVSQRHHVHHSVHSVISANVQCHSKGFYAWGKQSEWLPLTEIMNLKKKIKITY